MYVRPKKQLGQHFLVDQNIARKIVAGLKSGSDLTLIEIGPGTGVLTKILIDQYSLLYVVEIDTESVDWLNVHLPELKSRIIAEDFLTLNLDLYIKGPFSVIGNFPYNISSQIFFKLLGMRDRNAEIVCMIQKEVADRIRSGPGTKVYGILSVLLQTFYKVEYLFTVSNKVFNPPPKVQSAVIRLTRNERKELVCNEKLYFMVVKAAFNQRRKVLRNSLSALLNGMTEPEEMLSRRPEQMEIDDFIELTTAIEKHSNPSSLLDFSRNMDIGKK